MYKRQATLIIVQTNEVDRSKIGGLEKEIKVLKKDRDLFIAKTKKINASWKKFQSLHSKAIKMEDSLSLGNQKVKIIQEQNQLKKELQNLGKSLTDTAFYAIYKLAINNYQTMISNFENQVKDKKVVQSFKSNVGNEMELLAKIESLEKEKLELQAKYLQSLSGGANSSSCLLYTSPSPRD